MAQRLKKGAVSFAIDSLKETRHAFGVLSLSIVAGVVTGMSAEKITQSENTAMLAGLGLTVVTLFVADHYLGRRLGRHHPGTRPRN